LAHAEPSPWEKVKGYDAGVFHIAEFARIAGVSPRMLRKWDAAGLFRPAWVDPATGYRAYSPAQLPALRRALALRDLGMPLAEIAGLVSGGGDLREALALRRRALEASRRDLERRLVALDITVAMAEGAATPDVVVRPIVAEPVACLALEAQGGDDAAAFYELEAHVRDLGRRRSAPPGETEIHGRPAVYVPVTRPIAPAGRIRPAVLPAVRVATVLHRGPYGGLGEARRALEAWVGAAGMRSAGPLRVLYVQFGAEAELGVPPRYLVERSADLVTELQLPVD
jgi:DNA-binding transcriptional MerR regulator